MSSVKSKFDEWVETPPITVKEIPRGGEAILEVFRTEIVHSLYSGGTDIDLSGKLVGKGTKADTQVYPVARILKSSIDEYEEGDLVYLGDEILNTRLNPKYELWKAKQEKTRPQMMELPPDKFIGGLNGLNRYSFKSNKLSADPDKIDGFLFQLPMPFIGGHYK